MLLHNFSGVYLALVSALCWRFVVIAARNVAECPEGEEAKRQLKAYRTIAWIFTILAILYTLFDVFFNSPFS